MLDDAPGTIDTRDDDRAQRWAWGLCWLMFLSTALSYLDRQTVALVKPLIMPEFGISNEGFGWVLAAFQLTYAFFQVPAGFIADRTSAKRTYAGAVAWWSLAGIASAFSPSLGFLIACRIMLGVGESFNWPCALRVTGKILPPSARGLGNGIFNSGAAVGAVVAPLTIPPLADRIGWRPAFAIVGSIGFLWSVAWMWALRGERGIRLEPAASSNTSIRERSLSDARFPLDGFPVGMVLVGACSLAVAAGALKYGAPMIWWSVAMLMFGSLLVARLTPPDSAAGWDWLASLAEVTRIRRFWVLTVVSCTINVCWHFLVNWLPSYLQDDRGMNFVAGGMLSALPFIAADFGNLGGGWVSLRLARRGWRPARARAAVMALCTVLIASGAFVGLVRSDALTLALLAVMALGTAAFMANYFAFCQDVSPRHTGLVVGILGGLGNLFAAGFSPLAGRVKDTLGVLSPVFVVVGLLPFIGLATLWLGWGRGTERAG